MWVTFLETVVFENGEIFAGETVWLRRAGIVHSLPLRQTSSIYTADVLNNDGQSFLLVFELLPQHLIWREATESEIENSERGNQFPPKGKREYA